MTTMMMVMVTIMAMVAVAMVTVEATVVTMELFAVRGTGCCEYVQGGRLLGRELVAVSML